MLVEAWLPRAADRWPERVAVQTPHGAWSYEQLAAVAGWGAAWLLERGVAPGDRVAIALAPGLAFAQALHACLLVRAIAVPVDVRLADAERARIAAGAAVTIDEPLWEGPSAGAPELVGWHDTDAPALVIHTSGTTADPHAVVLTYGNLLWSALGSAVALGVDPRERWLSAMPLSHVGGLSILVRSAVYGTTALVHERFETDRVLHALREQEVTLVSLVATTLDRLLEGGLRNPPRLRCALTGGGPVPDGLLERAREAGVPVSQTYGLTESCSQATTVPVAAAVAGRGGLGAGPPLFCTRVRLGADEQIELSGPTLAPGAVDEDGWLRTGDVGRLDEAGRLHVTGRAADTIISGGENVAPAEVEAVLGAHPAVLEAAVVGRLDPRWGERVVALVRLRDGAALDEADLRAHCSARLAPYKVPREVVFVAEPLPRTASGKLRRGVIA